MPTMVTMNKAAELTGVTYEASQLMDNPKVSQRVQGDLGIVKLEDIL